MGSARAGADIAEVRAKAAIICPFDYRQYGRLLNP